MLIRPLDHDVDLLALHRYAPRRYPCLLESAAVGTPQARYDLLLAASGEGMRLDRDGVTRHLDGRPIPGRFLDALDAEWRQLRIDEASALPFIGGWALLLGYESSMQIEPTLRFAEGAAAGPPAALALRCPVALLRDRCSGQTIACAEDGHEIALLGLLDEAKRVTATSTTPPHLLELREDDPQIFLDGVQRILEYIAAGDVFQVNLSRGWEARLAAGGDVGSVYAALRRANPAPFAASLTWDDWAVLSSSPERLVSVRGDRVQTRPIAGTRARFEGDDTAARVRELIGHPKERAEHIMLIDLERNDLGRVCVPGSIKVDELMTVESYAHVHHIVSNVCGQLRLDATPGDVVRAVFPGGTITGCPKVRCMQIIAELEGVARGPYTGALGYLDRRGDLDLNILIRSLWMRGDTLSFRAGAGIVADSIAGDELAETRAKARGLLRALGAPG